MRENLVNLPYARPQDLPVRLPRYLIDLIRFDLHPINSQGNDQSSIETAAGHVSKQFRILPTLFHLQRW